MRALFTDVKEVELKKGKHTRKMNQGSVLIIFDGFLETDLKGRWQQKPLFWFLRAVYDRYVWPIWLNRFEGELSQEEEVPYLASGEIVASGRFFGRRGTHKIIRDGITLYYLQSSKYNLNLYLEYQVKIWGRKPQGAFKSGSGRCCWQRFSERTY